MHNVDPILMLAGALCAALALGLVTQSTLATVAVVIVGKASAAYAVMRLLRYPVSTALRVAADPSSKGRTEIARALNPSLRILARSAYVREVVEARAAGANVVVCWEVEVALAMAEVVLTELGATGKNLDRARQRTREDLAQGTHA